jgi:Spy/CpxP family protein refolding chaperone
MAAFIGCENSDTTSGATALASAVPGNTDAMTGFTPPAIDDLIEELNLTDEQATAMEVALTAWMTAMEERQAERQQNMQNREPGDRPGRPDGPRPAQTFLVACADFLDADQMVSLIAYLGDLREVHRNEMQAQRQEFMGQRGEGNGFGRGGKRHGDGDGPRGPFADLDLTDEQQAQLDALREEMRQAMQALRQENAGGPPNEATRQQMRTLHEQMREKMESILTAEQLAELEAARDARHEERSAQMQERFAARQQEHLEFLTGILGLTDAQQSQIESIMDNIHTQMQALHELMREEDADRDALREQAQDLRDSATSSILAVLDADQAKIFEALKDLMPGRGGPGSGGPGFGNRGNRFGH